MRPRPPDRAADPARRLAPLTALVAGAGAVLWLGLLPIETAAGSAFWLAVAVLTAAFVVTESTQIHVELNRQTVSLSLSELPLVVGLFLVDPVALLLARLTGALLVAVGRRTAPYKAGFNTALFTLEVGALVTLAGDVSPDQGPADWWLAFAAVMLVTLLSGLLLLAAVRRLHGPISRSDVTVTLAPLVSSAVLNTSLALIVVVLLNRDPQAAGLLAVVAVALIAAYRGYSVLLRRHRSLELVHDFVVSAAASSGTEQLVQRVLEHSRELLSADTALIVLPGARLVGTGEVFVLDGDQGVRPATPAQAQVVREAAARGTEVVHPEAPVPRRRLSAYAPEAGLEDAVGLPLPSDRGETGFLLVSNRRGSMSSLNASDLRLLTVIASQLSAALQNSDLLARLRQEATHDLLTGLPNRALFHERFEELRSEAAGFRGAVLLLDLDGFKEVNDTLGHHNGDALLREVARRLREAAPSSVTVSRLGGDEFALLVPADATGSSPLEFAERLQVALRRPCGLEGVQVDVRASLGIALIPEHGEHSAELLQRADVAMYAAKSLRTPIQVYDPDADHATPGRLALVGELRAAIEAGNLAVHYQPKIDLRDEHVTGAEALVRWAHPVLGMVPPDEFVQIAERTGLIVDLTRLVLDQALTQCRRWSDDRRDMNVAVNVSPRALLAPDFVDEVTRSLLRHAVPARLLTLEVTESSVMSDPDAAIAVLQRLHDLGVRLSVDDFGTGYSSLAYLQRLPVHEVKIDQSFVMTLAGDAGNTAIVRAICDLGHSLGLSVVAEGLEDAESQRVLQSLGCDIAQGYLISRPLAPDALDAWLVHGPVPARG
jgi:diguanylate cyclase (GGDEF)-like protein